MMNHGTRSTYNNHRCRCQPCTQAHNTYNRQLRAAHRAAPIPDGYHGIASTYTNRGCRCPECRQAHNTYNRQHRRRQ